MSNVFAIFEQRIKKLVQQLDVESGTELDLSRVTVEPPRDPAHGHLATNAAMVLAKPLKQNPRAIAEQLAEKLQADDDIAKVNVAGPGFINLVLQESFWTRHLSDILAAGAAYGGGATGGGVKVNVEYVSANPTGPMHVGHCRGSAT